MTSFLVPLSPTKCKPFCVSSVHIEAVVDRSCKIIFPYINVSLYFFMIFIVVEEVIERFIVFDDIIMVLEITIE